MEISKFASAHRASNEQLEADYALIKNSDWISSFINTMPEVVAILNDERQIIFANDELLKLLDVKDSKLLLGSRPGEVLKCINATLMDAGCGTCENCRYCGAVLSILESQAKSKKVTKDCRITTEENGVHEFLDLKVTTAPFSFQGNYYSILTIEDISDKHRRAMLERLFFHDILNIVGSLKGISDLLIRTQNDEETSGKYIGIVNKLSKELLEEILSQRVMINAEEGELVPENVEVTILDILNEPASYISHHQVAANKKIIISDDAYSGHIQIDPMLLKRVIINMLKNALEATQKGGQVKLNCRKENNFLLFTVQNPGFMPKNIQAQVFQRSFTTKGKGRGLGTYSIKLLTERYLKGTVGFSTSEEQGTEFYVKIPNPLM
ncbi:MAG: PAS domain-containing sensor histidine kinase [Bacteroidota bacterium]